MDYDLKDYLLRQTYIKINGSIKILTVYFEINLLLSLKLKIVLCFFNETQKY